MNLENKFHNNKNIFKRIARRAMPYVLTAGLGLAVMGCQEAPGSLPDKENNK